jgi:hypothetical protein
MSGPDQITRQLDLLQKLAGKGLQRASELASAPPASRRHPSLTHLFPAAERLAATPDGAALWRITTEIPADGRPTRAGYTCPAAAWGGPPTPEDLAALTGDPAWAGLDPAAILYLDTETTGLATGSGSLAFLIGLGRFDPLGRFMLEQFYIDDFAAEPLLIGTFDERLRAAVALVTYNGRCFDLPLLVSRWVLQRRPPRFPDLHLDLLHFARRFWRRVLPSCSLGSVEQHVLGLRRLSDLPSAMIPGIWLDAVAGRHPERLVPVFDHHAQDIASMGALAALMTRAIRRPDDPPFARAEIQHGLALLAEARGDRTATIARLEAAVLAARDPDVEFFLAMRLARAYKRLRRWDDALAVWRARVPHCRPHRLDPLLELAKHAEHVGRDLEAARRWTEQALALVQTETDMTWYGAGASLVPAARADLIHALRHRLARHERKLGRRPEGS